MKYFLRKSYLEAITVILNFKDVNIMTSKTQVTFTSNDSSPSGLSTSKGSISSSEDTTEIEQTIDNLISKIRQPAFQPKKMSEEKRNKMKYDRLLSKIKRDQAIIAQLEIENRALKDEVSRCEAKIRSYPRMKSKYDKLSESLSRSAEVYSSTKSLSSRRRPFT